MLSLNFPVCWKALRAFGSKGLGDQQATLRLRPKREPSETVREAPHLVMQEVMRQSRLQQTCLAWETRSSRLIRWSWVRSPPRP